MNWFGNKYFLNYVFSQAERVQYKEFIMNERTKAIISAVIIIIVNVAAMFNVSLDQDILVKACFGVADLVVTIWAIWKNHNFTAEAAKAQEYLDTLKSNRG